MKVILTKMYSYVKDFNVTESNFTFENLHNIYNMLVEFENYFVYDKSNKTSTYTIPNYYNEKYSNKLLRNVQLLEFPNLFFESFYISLDYYLYKNSKDIILYKLKEYMNIYDKLFHIYLNHKDYILDNYDKSFYGIIEKILIFSHTSFYSLDLGNYSINLDILDRYYFLVNSVMNKLWKNFKSSIITIDIDKVYYRWNPKLNNYIDNISYMNILREFEGVNYIDDYGKVFKIVKVLSNIDNMNISQKKRYLCFSDEVFSKFDTIKGFPDYY